MKLKTVITVALLVFVMASIAVLTAREAGLDGTRDALTTGTGDPPGTPLKNDHLIVYYFHGNVRCPTCLTLEAYSRETVEMGFAAELADGRMDWRIVNYDETWNEHFLQDYDLSFQSLVLVSIKNGTQVEYRNLRKIWELVDDKAAYTDYVQREIRAQLAKL